MNDTLEVKLGRVNLELGELFRELAASRGPGELCALEGSSEDAAVREDRRALVREGLERFRDPSRLGLVFVVTLAELAYEVDWRDQFSFWPQLNELLAVPEWTAEGASAHRLISASFERFSAEFGALRPQGRFAARFPYVSWPLFHAVLPQAAQRRMARLLARVAAEPRLAIEASGTPDEQALGVLLRETAGVSSDTPAYFEGLLQHPSLAGRLGASLLMAARQRVAGATPGLSERLVMRLLADLRKDRVARSQLEGAARALGDKQVRAKKRASALEGGSVEPLRLGLTLELGRQSPALMIEAGPLPELARAWPPLAQVLTHASARLQVLVGQHQVPAGYLSNLLHGVVCVGAPLSSLTPPLSLGAEIRLPGDREMPEELSAYLSRSAQQLSLPLVFRKESGSKHYRLGAPELSPGAELVVLCPARQAQPLGAAAGELGLAPLLLGDAPDLAGFVGKLPNAITPGFQLFSRALGLREPVHSAEVCPVIVAPARVGAELLEWRKGDDAFLEIVTSLPPEDVQLRLEGGSGGAQSLELRRDSAQRLIVWIPAAELAPGRLVLGRRDGAVLRSVSIGVRAQRPFREPSPRFHATLMPRGATRAHLLGGACWVDVDALPGLELRLELSASGSRASHKEVRLPVEQAGPLQTAAALKGLVSRVVEELGGPDAALRCSYTLSIASLDERGLQPVVIQFPEEQDALDFRASDDSATLWVSEETETPLVTRLVLDPQGATESPCELPDKAALATAADSIFIARNAGAAAALAWARDSGELPSLVGVERPVRGGRRALELVRLLRVVEMAVPAPLRRSGRAALVRQAAASSLERELVGALCGRAWLDREETTAGALTMGEPARLIQSYSTLLWVSRDWLREGLPRLLEETSGPLEALSRACESGVGEWLRPDAEAKARHLLLLFLRRQMASEEDDAACLEWAGEDVQRARLVRLLYLASASDPLRSQGQAEEVAGA